MTRLAREELFAGWKGQLLLLAGTTIAISGFLSSLIVSIN